MNSCIVLSWFRCFILAFVLTWLHTVSHLFNFELVDVHRGCSDDRKHSQILMILLMELPLLFSGTLPKDIHFDSSLALRLLFFDFRLSAFKLKDSSFETFFINILVWYHFFRRQTGRRVRLNLMSIIIVWFLDEGVIVLVITCVQEYFRLSWLV